MGCAWNHRFIPLPSLQGSSARQSAAVVTERHELCFSCTVAKEFEVLSVDPAASQLHTTTYTNSQHAGGEQYNDRRACGVYPGNHSLAVLNV